FGNALIPDVAGRVHEVADDGIVTVPQEVVESIDVGSIDSLEVAKHVQARVQRKGVIAREQFVDLRFGPILDTAWRSRRCKQQRMFSDWPYERIVGVAADSIIEKPGAAGAQHFE